MAKVFRTILVVMSFAIALSTIGLDLSSFAILGGAIGVGIGFGLQKVAARVYQSRLLDLKLKFFSLQIGRRPFQAIQ